jgi:hypothetical protein
MGDSYFVAFDVYYNTGLFILGGQTNSADLVPTAESYPITMAWSEGTDFLW